MKKVLRKIKRLWHTINTPIGRGISLAIIITTTLIITGILSNKAEDIPVDNSTTEKETITATVEPLEVVIVDVETADLVPGNQLRDYLQTAGNDMVYLVGSSRFINEALISSSDSQLIKTALYTDTLLPYTNNETTIVFINYGKILKEPCLYYSVDDGFVYPGEFQQDQIIKLRMTKSEAIAEGLWTKEDELNYEKNKVASANAVEIDLNDQSTEEIFNETDTQEEVIVDYTVTSGTRSFINTDTIPEFGINYTRADLINDDGLFIGYVFVPIEK